MLLPLGKISVMDKTGKYIYGIVNSNPSTSFECHGEKKTF